MTEKELVYDRIDLDNPVLVVGLDGWGNAGEVSTFTVEYLSDKLGAKKFGEINPQPFHGYLIQRPKVSIEEGLIQLYEPPTHHFYYWRNDNGAPDLVLLQGNEPHLNWPLYTESLLAVVNELGVNRVYTLGGYFAEVSHKQEPKLTASTNNEGVLPELVKAGLMLTSYQGPTSVYSEILWKSRDRGVDVISIWCAVPMYVKSANPKASYHMVEALSHLTGLRIDLSDLKKRAESFNAALEGEIESRPQIQTLVGKLGKRRGEGDETTYIS